MAKKIDHRGGVRPGAGRPRTGDRKKIQVYLSVESIARLEVLAREWKCSRNAALMRLIAER